MAAWGQSLSRLLNHRDARESHAATIVQPWTEAPSTMLSSP